MLLSVATPALPTSLLALSTSEFALPSVSLDKLPVGETGTVLEITKESLRVKLLEMGCLPGERIEVMQRAPFGGPIAIEVFGYTLSLRRDEARCIVVELDDIIG